MWDPIVIANEFTLINAIFFVSLMMAEKGRNMSLN